MSKNRNQNKILTFVFSHIITIVLLGAVLWLAGESAKVIYAKVTARKEVDNLKREIEEMERRNSELSSLMSLFNDPEIVELEAKRRLNLKKPGEKVAVVLRDKDDEPQNIIQTKEDVAEGSVLKDKEPPNILKWWAYITRN